MSPEYSNINSSSYVDDSSKIVELTQSNKKSTYSEVRLKRDAYDHEEKVKAADHEHELALQDRNLGTLGRFFGADENSSKNITFVIIFIMVAIALLLTYVSPPDKDKNDFITMIWDKIFPLVTLSLGYIFGKK